VPRGFANCDTLALSGRRRRGYDPSMIYTDIVTKIDQRLDHLRGEITRLEHARTSLLNDVNASSTPKRRRAKRAPGNATRRVVPAERLRAALAGSAGMTTGELAKATNGDSRQLLSLLKEQEDAGEVRRSGERRGTRWHVITDEDRIAARAAELENQRQRTRAGKN
jgi:hypothetical protein